MSYANVAFILYPSDPVVCCIAGEATPNEDQCLIHSEERERLQKRINASVITCEIVINAHFARHGMTRAGRERIIPGNNGKLYWTFRSGMAMC
jgi:hypothetical protein